jgi:hypothetical protein
VHVANEVRVTNNISGVIPSQGGDD